MDEVESSSSVRTPKKSRDTYSTTPSISPTSGMLARTGAPTPASGPTPSSRRRIAQHCSAVIGPEPTRNSGVACRPRKYFEVRLELGDERRIAGLERVVLGLPVVARAGPRCGRSAGRSRHRGRSMLVGEGHHATVVALWRHVDEPMGRVPRRDRRLEVGAGQLDAHGAADAGRHVVAAHEPAVHPRPGGERLPDRLGCGGRVRSTTISNGCAMSGLLGLECGGVVLPWRYGRR